MNPRQRERRRNKRIIIEARFTSIHSEYDRDYLSTNYHIENLEIKAVNTKYPSLIPPWITTTPQPQIQTTKNSKNSSTELYVDLL
jgi:hypothetical protein